MVNSKNNQDKNRWLALAVLCVGTLMEVLDSTIVNVALPSIRTDLHFSEASLAWVINAYLLTFGGLLLLGGRLGDIFGNRKLFLIGISLFTAASLACGLSGSQWILITARATQGVGGAILSAVSLSLVMNIFTKPHERARAMGYFGFVAAGGGSIGVLLGGLLTTVNWHLIFLVNIPIGILVLFFALRLLPKDMIAKSPINLDIWGSVTITSSLMLAVYAIVNGNQKGWLSTQTLGLLALSIAILAIFVFIESRVKSPLVPFSLFRLRNLTVSNIIGALWAASMFAWFFLSALYLQLVLGYSPLKVGLSFLPANLIMAVFSVWLSAKIVMRFGVKMPLAIGLSLAALGLLLFTQAPVNGTFLQNVLPSMILLGFGAGLAFNPVFLAAMNDVQPQDSGLASGLVNTSFMLGGALGLAILVSLAASQTIRILGSGQNQLTALVGGYHVAFLVGAIFALSGGVIGALFLRVKTPSPNTQTP